jgi:hypothetical protein
MDRIQASQSPAPAGQYIVRLTAGIAQDPHAVSCAAATCIGGGSGGSGESRGMAGMAGRGESRESGGRGRMR